MNVENHDMDDEIQIIADDEGMAVIGCATSVDRFLESKGLADTAEKLDINGLGTLLNTASMAAGQFSSIAENSSRYIKLTKESANLRKELGLMPTKKNGISHIMVGQPGDISRWLQAEEGLTGQLTNPAVLTGVAGFLAQAARQQEAREVKEFLVKIDQKLDDVQRRQRDAVLSKMDRVSDTVRQAMIVREHNGDLLTVWGKVEAESATISEVQSLAFRELEALSEKVANARKIGKLEKDVQKAEREAGVWLAVLARCYELHNALEIIELDYVAMTSPERLEGHRQGLDKNREERRSIIGARTSHLIACLVEAGDIAEENVLLHVLAARKAVAAINGIGDMVNDFRRPLGIDAGESVIELTSWRTAFRDQNQLKTAAKEIGKKGGSAVAVGATTVGAILLSQKVVKS